MKAKSLSTAVLFVVLLLVSACSTAEALEDYAGLTGALEAAGESVEPGGPVEQPFLSEPGQILRVNGMDVQVFEYESAEQLEADAAKISPEGGSTDTTMITWMATPHFFKSGQLLVLYVGDDAGTLNVLESVLGEQFAGG